MRTHVSRKPSKIPTRVKRSNPKQDGRRQMISRPGYSHGSAYFHRPVPCPCDGGCPRCITAIQPKLTIGQPDNMYEQEADSVAEQVMRMPEPRIQRQDEEDEGEEITMLKPVDGMISHFLQRQPIEEEEEELMMKSRDGPPSSLLLQRQSEEEDEGEEYLQMNSTSPAAASLSPRLSVNIGELTRQHSGSPFPTRERNFFEPRFGRDFKNVRIHSDRDAADLAQALNARAFTFGRDVIFGPGEYAPSTPDGQRLIAHELTHVIQQSADSGHLKLPEDRIQRSDLYPSDAECPKCRISQTPIIPHSASLPPFLPETADGVLNAGSVKWKKHPDIPKVYGQVYYARHKIPQWPSFYLKNDNRWFGYSYSPKKTVASEPVWSCIATPENLNGYKTRAPHVDYPGYDCYVRVSAKAAKIIKECEQQHLHDLNWGWRITGRLVRNAINLSAEEEGPKRDTPQEAKNAAVDKMVKKLGKLGKEMRSDLESRGHLESYTLGPAMDKAFQQTKEQRDDTGNHRIPTNFVRADHQNKTVLFEADENFIVDKTLTTEIVSWKTIL